MNRSLFGSVAFLLGCGPPELPSDLGEHALDQVRLSEASALVHLAEAAEGGGAELSVEDLFVDRPAYGRAPDPSELFEAARAEHEALPALESSVELRVLSFNAGLLDRWYPFAVARVPQIDTRREILPQMLLSDGWDVLLLQEVWEDHDLQRFADQAAASGYLHYGGTADRRDAHGMLILVRESLVDPSGPDERREEFYELQRDLERFPGPGLERGYLAWRFVHAPSGRTVHLFDNHTTAFPELSRIRDTQARQLGLAIDELPDDELVIAGGDFNSAPYYPWDEYGEVGGEPERDWWRNAQAYALMLHYAGAVDVHAAAGIARDVGVMNALPTFGPDYQREPLGDASLCDALVQEVTASDCNSLYFEQYAATEYSARIDFIFYRDRAAHARVQQVAIEYTENLPGESFEPSDHYGVSAIFQVSDR